MNAVHFSPVAPDPPQEATMADLEALVQRCKAAESKMSVANQHRALIGECAWWMVNLAKQVIELRRAAAPKPEPSRIILPPGVGDQLG